MAMTTDRLVLYSAILAWLMLVTASFLRGRFSLAVGFSNRDALPPPTPLSERADRAAKNMLENLLLFVAVVVAAERGARSDAQVLLGAQLFFFARLAYWPTYLAGVIYVRTVLWAIAVFGLGLIASQLL
jgi:uncharacterized MAPEG superfamily protein